MCVAYCLEPEIKTGSWTKLLWCPIDALIVTWEESCWTSRSKELLVYGFND